MSERLLFETHSHTPLCKHAIGSPSEYAAVAEARGLRGLLVTCHNPMPDGFSAGVRMRPDQIDEYVDLVALARDEWLGRVDVRLGLEADYFPGYETWLERQLSSAEFHYVLGSVHPQIDEFRQCYWAADATEVQRTYFRLLAEAAETGLFDCLAHPDLIKNMTAEDWQPTKIMDDIRRSLDRIAATGMAMELNTSGVNKLIAEMNPFPKMLAEMSDRGIPVCIGADAHEPGRVADRFGDALRLLESTGYQAVSFFLNRKRQEISIDAAVASLAEPASS
ncbi:MAG: histidinol-phosphatase [Planctomycetaceae bacterium]|nr:histidinol-phosphatase [Planctomycetales bacterium]MCB9920579.1 histidinol-phosphatase [Planctomycetaceae bacterium]